MTLLVTYISKLVSSRRKLDTNFDKVLQLCHQKHIYLLVLRLVFEVSCFTTASESRYSTERELLAVVFAHGILYNKEFNKISSNQINTLKNRINTWNMKTCKLYFTTKYCLGNWHRGADAVSWNPINAKRNDNANVILTNQTVITLQQIHHITSLPISRGHSGIYPGT